jgi:poly(ribitol-phosphate) beta-N-acetylglucosaminyltransferase
VRDVTVVLAVYNVMPYLTKCLDSLVEQTIGRDRLEIVAVDDGSADGSGAELDRYARRYPGTIKVLHQANSGGPAAPSNRALEIATGRYVFFIGADDFLGPDALRRMVTAADEYGSDVIVAKMAGVNSRWVPKDIFSHDQIDVDLFTSPLPFALSNTKLFRRELIERHHLRYPEDLPVGSDQPFTLEACVRAQRITVLADYEYYYAVRRHNSGNITYRSPHELRLECTERLMAFTATLLEPGPRRDAINYRHLHTELCRLLQPDFLPLDRATQERLIAGIGRLVKENLTEELSARLDVSRRLRLQLAAAGRLDELISVIEENAAKRKPPTVIDGNHVFIAYKGFRDPALGLPDAWFFVTDDPDEALVRQLSVTGLAWQSRTGALGLTVAVSGPVPADRLAATPITVSAGAVCVAAVARGTSVQVWLPVSGIIESSTGRGDRLRVKIHPGAPPAGDREILVRNDQELTTGRRLTWHRQRPYMVNARSNSDGKLVIDVVPVTARQVINRLRRTISGGSKKA